MPLLLSNRRFPCDIACELWANASSGVFPMAQPLFSGLIAFVCIFRRPNVSPKCRSGQFNNTDNKACVAQLFGTETLTNRQVHEFMDFVKPKAEARGQSDNVPTCCAKNILLTFSSSLTNISAAFSTTFRRARLSSVHRNKNINLEDLHNNFYSQTVACAIERAIKQNKTKQNVQSRNDWLGNCTDLPINRSFKRPMQIINFLHLNSFHAKIFQ